MAKCIVYFIYVLFFVTSSIKSILIRSKGIRRARRYALITSPACSFARRFVNFLRRRIDVTERVVTVFRTSEEQSLAHIIYHECFPQWTFFRSLITRLSTHTFTRDVFNNSCLQNGFLRSFSAGLCRLRNCHDVRRG